MAQDAPVFGRVATQDALAFENGATQDTPNIIWIVIDTTRADQMSFLGYSRDTTPNLAALAEDSVVFTQAVSPASWSLPSFASLLSGTLATNHEFHRATSQKLASPYVAELGELGYQTVSVQTNQWLTNLTGDFESSYSYFYFPTRDDSMVDELAIDKSMQWVSTEQGEPFFLFLGLFSPHRPYTIREPYFSEFLTDATFANSPATELNDALFNSDPHTAGYITYGQLPEAMRPAGVSDDTPVLDSRVYVAAYDSEIRHADDMLGAFFTFLKAEDLYDDALIIVTADHGESFDEHDVQFSHGNNVYDSETHVPLLIKYPGQTEQLVVDVPVATIGIFPTIFDYAGFPQPATDAATLSLLDISRIEATGGQAIISQNRAKDAFSTGVRVGEATALEIASPFGYTSPTYELYDLVLDTAQQINLLAKVAAG